MDILNLLAQVQVHIDGLPQVALDQASVRNALSTTFAVGGGMATLFLLVGAARYAVAAGDPGQLKQARDTILYSLIGLVVALSGFFIVQFVLGSLV